MYPSATKMEEIKHNKKIKYVIFPHTLTHSKPKYLKWNLGFKYKSSIHPYDQNLTIDMAIISPKPILKTANGEGSAFFLLM